MTAAKPFVVDDTVVKEKVETETVTMKIIAPKGVKLELKNE